jgi:Mg2+/Co2+ transporter CorB
MLLSILDLEKVTVDDIMVPRTEVMGLDLDNDWDAIVGQLAHTQHTFLPVYRQDLNNIKGIIHAKKVLHLFAHEDEFTEETLLASLDDVLFVPQGTSLTKQMINFQRAKRRFAMVVDEYGDILGVIALEDILEEIVGDFTTNMSASFTAILEQEDGSYLVDGSTTVREFNQFTEYKLPTTGPKTINGLVIEQLQAIPEIGTCCLIGGNVPIEVVQVQDNKIKSIKIFPPIVRKTHSSE